MDKYRLYIDEVGNAASRSETDPERRYLSLTGVIFRTPYVKRVLAPDLHALKAEFLHHHPDDPAILHRSKIEGMRGHYQRLKAEGRKEAFYDALAEFIRSHNYRVIVTGLDKYRHFEIYKAWPEDPYHICLFNMLERYFLFLQARRAVGDVYIENRHPKSDGKLLSVYEEFYKNGNVGGSFKISPEDIQKRFTTGKLAIRHKYHNIAGLQVADVVACTMHNYCVGTYGAHDILTEYDARLLPHILKPRLLTDDKGSPEGWGIVWRPKTKRAPLKEAPAQG